MFKKIISLVALASLPVAVALGQSAPDSLFVLPEVTIVATRFELSPDALPARVTRMDRASIELYADRSLSELLEHRGSGFVRRYGPGGLAGISLRGSGPNHTAILLDGQRLTDPQLGQIDLSLLPTLFVSAVEQLHGGGSSRFGSDAIAGAINLSTLVPHGSSVRLATRAGAWGERSAGAAGTLVGSRTDVTVAAEIAAEDGDFSFIDRSRFPTARSDRTNADRESVNVFLKARHRRSRSVTEVAGWLVSAERGLPSTAGSAPSGERQWDRISRLWLAQHWYGSAGITNLQVSAQKMSIRYANRTIEIDEEGVTRSLTAGVSRDQRLGSALRLIAGADAGVQSAEHPSLGDGVSQSGAAVHASGLVSASDRVNVFPSFRMDWFVRDGRVTNSVNPAVRARVDLARQSRWSLKGGVERSFRMPTFNDLHWRGAYASGNPGLRPERGVSVDAGVEMDIARFSGEVTTFYQSIRNRITWLPDDTGTWRPENIGSARSVGIEVGGTQEIGLAGAEVTISASYEFVHATDRSSRESEIYGKPLRYAPRHTLRSGVDLDRRHWSAGVTVRFVGRRYVTGDATSWLDPYTVIDTRVASQIKLGTTALGITVALENLGSSDYQIMSGYPMPPRHLRVQVAVTI